MPVDHPDHGSAPPIELPQLSDEAAVQIHDFIYAMLDLFEARYGDQIHRFHADLSAHNMIEPDSSPSIDDPPF
jgi:hypothetical protein